MNKLRILIRNIGDSATVDSASPALLPTLPASNLQTQPRGEIFRTDGLSSQEIRFTWDSNQSASMVALVGHNLTTAGTIRAQGYSDTGFGVGSPDGLLFDSTALPAFSVASLDEEDAADYLEADFRRRKSWVHYFAEVSTLRALKLTFADAANPDGYMEASRLFVGKYFSPQKDPPFGGLQLAPGSMTKSGRLDGGSLRSDRGADFLQITITLPFILDADVSKFLALVRRLGKHRDFWFDFYPDLGEAREIYHRGQFKFTDLGPLEPHFSALHRRTMVMEEP